MDATPTPRAVSLAATSMSSTVRPECESAMTRSPGPAAPKSPWCHSLPCTHPARMPNERSEIARRDATAPDFPIPVTSTCGVDRSRDEQHAIARARVAREAGNVPSALPAAATRLLSASASAARDREYEANAAADAAVGSLCCARDDAPLALALTREGGGAPPDRFLPASTKAV